MGKLVTKNAEEFGEKNFSIISLFEECAEKHKDKVALIFEDKSLSYGELNVAANQLAHYLQQQGITKETPVAICLERSFSLIISLLAVLKAGGTYVPLDPSYPEERIFYMIQDTKAPIIITQKTFEEKPSFQESSVLIWETLSRVTKDFPTNNPLSPATPDSLAYIIYTSGSTGQPKGVMIEHQSLHDRFIVLQSTFSLNKEDRILFHTSISFDVSLEEILWPLAYGSIIVIARSGFHQDIENFSKIISDHEVTFLQVVPSFLKTFLYLPHIKETFRTVRKIFVGGEVLSFSLLKNCIKELPHVEFINVYGPTEATVDSTFLRCSKALIRAKRKISIGTPLAGVRIYLLDEQLTPVQFGEKGEICIAGLGLARGYFNLLHETTNKFPYLSSINERVFRTGDLGRFLNNGQLEYLGRFDQQVKINGVRIEIEEIENTLNDNLYVTESAVLLNEMKTGFDAYVVLNDGLRGKSQAEKELFLKNSIEKRLLSLMVPKQFIFIDSLPKNPNGKLDRQKLKEKQKKLMNKRKDSAFIIMNEEEEKLIAIWKALLKVDSVTINDNFFTLGGDSLTAVQMVLAAGREGIKIAIDKFFQTPTIKELISESSLKKIEELPTIQPTKKHTSYPLSFNQQSLWFFQHFSLEKNVYNVPFAFLINEKINGEILQKALLMLINRHESLRTVFIFDDKGHGVQKILEEIPFYLLENDLTVLSKQFQDQKLREFIEKDMGTSFDLEQAPLLRIRLLKFDSSHFALILTLHHIIADGYSMRLFFRDLQVYYKAIVDKKKAPILPNLTIQYKDFSVWQRETIKSNLLEKQLLYWKGKLKSRDEELKLADFSKPQFLSYKGTTYFTTLPLTLVEKIESFTKTIEGTNFITFVSAFSLLLSFFTDKRDIIIGSPFMNRSSIDLENVIGFLANPLPIYVAVDFQRTFAEHYQKVKKVIRESIENQNIPLEYVVEKLGVSRTSSTNPFFQVMFVLEENKVPYSLNEVKLEKINIQSHTSKLDLTLTIIKEDLETICEFEYSIEIFKASTIKNLAFCWEKLLSIVVVNPTYLVENIYSILKSQIKIK